MKTKEKNNLRRKRENKTKEHALTLLTLPATLMDTWDDDDDDDGEGGERKASAGRECDPDFNRASRTPDPEDSEDNDGTLEVMLVSMKDGTSTFNLI